MFNRRGSRFSPPSGKIQRDFVSQITPEGKREGGIMNIFDIIQPINA